MIFLPIADRELRVAARKRSTFRVRIVAALVAVLIAGGFLVLSSLWSVGFGAGTLGKGLFALLTWLGLAAALSTGLFLTSDCLSEEKREGTLGFLFLTDLRGHDVVFGKMLATSLRAFYALLAVFPILAVTLLMGGVTGAQFWKTSVALVSAMFVSLAAGLFVSAISRDSSKALGATLLLVLALAAGGPAWDAGFAVIRKDAFQPVASLTSPVYLFVVAGAWGRAPFWSGLLINQAVGGVLLALSCVLLPRTWQEKATKTTSPGDWSQRWKFGSVKRRVTLRRRLLEANPVLWLACRERWQSAALWLVTILIAASFAVIFASDAQWMFWFAWNYVANVFVLALYLGLTAQAARFFVDARRSGLIELVLATPLTVGQIVRGQWLGLLRLFGPPVALCLVAQLLGAVLAHQMTWSRMANVPVPPVAPPPSATNQLASSTTNLIVLSNAAVVTTATGTGTTMVSFNAGFEEPGILVGIVTAVGGTLTILANLVALIWFGMWMGLSSRSTNLATLKTILFVQIIPWFALTFASMLVLPILLLPMLVKGGAVMPTQMMIWFPLLASGLMTALCLIKDAAFTFWARRRLHSKFREHAARTLQPVQGLLSPPLPRMAMPPVIVQPATGAQEGSSAVP